MPQAKGSIDKVIVIGASAGGVEAIIQVLKMLPAGLPAAVFVVQHIPAFSRSNLDRVLQNYTDLRVKKAEDGEPIERGLVYVGVADHHLLVEPGRIVVSKGPRENRFRPAVDTLFRSAAHAYRNRVIGIILSGALNDGTSGMWTIDRLGGTTIVQDPNDALFADMPVSVMDYVDVDHRVPASEIGKLIGDLCERPAPPRGHAAGISNEKLLQIEVDIAKGKNGLQMGILKEGKRSALACPECHGALTQFEEGKLIRFRCHTGHAHSADSLLASVNENIEKGMWEVMRGMEESRIILDKLAAQLEESGQWNLANDYRRRADEVQQRARNVQQHIQTRDLPDKAETESAAAR
jgi:two-component system chemotaxis response regulator CheB